MQRIIHRQVTTIQITSIEVLWDEDRHPFPHEIVDAEIVAPLLPEPKARKRNKKTRSEAARKTGTRRRAGGTRKFHQSGAGDSD